MQSNLISTNFFLIYLLSILVVWSNSAEAITPCNTYCVEHCSKVTNPSCMSTCRNEQNKYCGGVYGRKSSNNHSCLMVYTRKYYKFKILNKTKALIYYKINGIEYSLGRGYERNHSYPKARGTNSCDIKNYQQPIISFDSSRAQGYQEKKSVVGKYKKETFRERNNIIMLSH